MVQIAECAGLRAGDIVAVGEDVDGLKLLVLNAGSGLSTLTLDGVAFCIARPDPCGGHATVSADLSIRPGDCLLDLDTGLMVRCLRGGAGEIRCDGRFLVAGSCG